MIVGFHVSLYTLSTLLHPLIRWSILSFTSLHYLHNESSWLLLIFDFTKFFLILWFSPFESQVWSEAQHCSLLTSLLWLKYCLWPWPFDYCCFGPISDIHTSNYMRLLWRKLLQSNPFIPYWWLSWGITFSFYENPILNEALNGTQ